MLLTQGMFYIHESCVDIAHYMENKIRKTVVKSTVLKQNKMSVMNDESMTINGKTALVVCFRTAVGASRDPQSCYFDLKCSSNETIYDALLNCLQKSGFSMEYLRETLILFVSDGASVTLGQTQLLQNYFLTVFLMPLRISLGFNLV
jgi:hypothetical protein